MPDDVLKKAEDRRAALLRELDEIDVFIRTYKRFSGGMLSGAIQADPVKVVVRHRTRPSLARALSETQKTVDMVREIIAESGHPVPLGSLYRALKNRGMDMPGKKPANTLGARLSNSAEVVSLRGFGWWLAEKPYPLGDYKPPDAEPADDHGGPSAGALFHKTPQADS